VKGEAPPISETWIAAMNVESLDPAGCASRAHARAARTRALGLENALV
jgi:hypothetical protein